MAKREDYIHTITVKTEDITILYCLRSIAHLSQETGNTQIPWAGTTRKIWIEQGNKVVFRFTDEKYKNKFINEAKRILPQNSFEIV